MYTPPLNPVCLTPYCTFCPPPILDDPKPPKSEEDYIGLLLDHARYKLISKLGSGAHGTVYLAVGQDKIETKFAIKRINFSPLITSSSQVEASQELTIYRKVKCIPGVVKLHRAFEEVGYIWVVMDYYEGGDLSTKARRSKLYLGDDELIRSIFLQLIATVSCLHAIGVYHLDLKPHNIMVSADGKTVSIGDFGNAGTLSVIHTLFDHGTSYSAPEAHGCSVFGLKTIDSYSAPHADIWSLGAIFVKLLTQRHLWETPDRSDPNFACFLKRQSGGLDVLIYPPFNLHITSEANTIIRGLLHLNPICRTSLAELRNSVVQAKRFTMTRQEFQYYHPSSTIPHHLPDGPAFPPLILPPSPMGSSSPEVEDDRPRKRARRESNAT